MPLKNPRAPRIKSAPATKNKGLAANEPAPRVLPPLPPRFEGREREFLDAALKQNSLFYLPQGRFVSRMLERAKAETKTPYAVATSSGSASLHVAVAAVGVEPGDEVITSPITDMGSLIGVLYQNAIPVFADVDPRTYHVTARTIEAVMTPRTRAVIVVHLSGSPVDMDPIVALCRRRGVALIEDCAQAFGCAYKQKPVGSMGDIGCFSLNDFKHLSCGDGGFIVTRDEKRFYAAHNFADKFYDRHKQGVRLTQLAPNYRMSELQAAVALAQFDQLAEIAQQRNALGTWLTELLQDVPGILTPKIIDGGFSSYWFYLLRVDEKKIGMSRDQFAERLAEQGIPADPSYIARPLYREPMFEQRSFFAGGIWPAERVAGREYDYRKISCPQAERVLATAVRLPVHQGYSMADIEYCARVIRKVAGA